MKTNKYKKIKAENGKTFRIYLRTQCRSNQYYTCVR